MELAEISASALADAKLLTRSRLHNFQPSAHSECSAFSDDSGRQFRVKDATPPLQDFTVDFSRLAHCPSSKVGISPWNVYQLCVAHFVSSCCLTKFYIGDVCHQITLSCDVPLPPLSNSRCKHDIESYEKPLDLRLVAKGWDQYPRSSDSLWASLASLRVALRPPRPRRGRPPPSQGRPQATLALATSRFPELPKAFN